MRWIKALLRSLSQRAEGGHVTPREHGDAIPVMLSSSGHMEEPPF